MARIVSEIGFIIVYDILEGNICQHHCQVVEVLIHGINITSRSPLSSEIRTDTVTGYLIVVEKLHGAYIHSKSYLTMINQERMHTAIQCPATDPAAGQFSAHCYCCYTMTLLFCVCLYARPYDYCIRHIFCGGFIFVNFASRVLFANLTIYRTSDPARRMNATCVRNASSTVHSARARQDRRSLIFPSENE